MERCIRMPKVRVARARTSCIIFKRPAAAVANCRTRLFLFFCHHPPPSSSSSSSVYIFFKFVIIIYLFFISFLARVDHLRESATTTTIAIAARHTRFLSRSSRSPRRRLYNIIFASSAFAPTSFPTTVTTAGRRMIRRTPPLRRCHVSNDFAHQNAPVYATPPLSPRFCRTPTAAVRNTGRRHRCR